LARLGHTEVEPALIQAGQAWIEFSKLEFVRNQNSKVNKSV
jgi:hypothetical protein